MRLELLWTDKCFLIVLGVGLILILFSLRKRHIRQSFSIIMHQPIAASAAVVLLLYLIIGVLDCIHYKPAQNGEAVRSVLDTILAPLGDSFEKTYSAPFALKSFVSETQFVDGVAKQVYLPLKYPNFQSSKDKHAFINQVLWSSLGYSLIVALLCIGLNLALRLAFKKPIFQISAARISVLLTLFVLAFLIVASFNLSRTFHIFGTGQIGQDVFYFSIKSIRTGLIIGLLTTLFMMPLALFLGISAGYFGGVVDDIIQYLYTTLSSIPGVLLITASVLSLQTYISSHPDQFDTIAKSADARLLALCFILGVTSWTSLCRLLRAEALKLREIDFVTAGRALGSNWFSIFRKHLLPNVMHIVIITLVLDFSFLVLAEAVLSYVGVGVSPTTISWGNMINGARLELARDPIVWWPILAAFVLMFFLVLAINLFADAVRDAFDPHQSRL